MPESKKYEKKSCRKEKYAEHHESCTHSRPLLCGVGYPFALYHIIGVMFDGLEKPAPVSPHLLHSSKHSFPLIAEMVSTSISMALRASRRSHIST